MPTDETDYSKELYKDSSNRLTKGYIVMITFVLVFFIAALFPYFDLLRQREALLSDSIIGNLTILDRLLSDQERILRTIQNYIDLPTLAAIDDYKKLDEYFRKAELIDSKAIASSSNISVSQLDTIFPTFLKCNQDFHRDINRWMICNAENVADGVNKKIMLRYQNIGDKIVPLQEKAMHNLKDFKLTASPLILDKNGEISVKLEKLDIDPDVWKQTIDNSSGRMINWVTNINNTLDFVLLNKSAVPWHLLENPSKKLIYKSEDQLDFKQILYSLNQSKNQVEKEIRGLSEKFEEVEYPIVGKIPLGFTTAVIIYPAAIGVGSLICSYYLGQAISKRSHLHRALAQKFDKELYPLWVEPKTNNFVRFVRLLLFVSVPLIVLLVTTFLVYLIPIREQSIFDMPQASIMITSCYIGYFLIITGMIIVAMKLKEYKMPARSSNR